MTTRLTAAHDEHGEAAAEPLALKAHEMAVAASLTALLLGMALAWLTYIKQFISAENAARRFSLIHRVLLNKYYVDEFYMMVIVRPFLGFSAFVAGFDKWIIDGIVNMVGYLGRGIAALVGLVDSRIVDGAVNGIADASTNLGRGLSRIQTGRIGNYLMGIVVGVVFLSSLVFMVVWRWS
jgi:NADH:ubiquinone oxidoreductase subunit 5 (subunit L)/multisubunit Na+/H+ antiporter MnhA subunit